LPRHKLKTAMLTPMSSAWRFRLPGSSRTRNRARWPLPAPAYAAIQNVGEDEFHRAALEQAQGQLRNVLPLQADINVVGYLARKPEAAERA